MRKSLLVCLLLPVLATVRAQDNCRLVRFYPVSYIHNGSFELAPGYCPSSIVPSQYSLKQVLPGWVVPTTYDNAEYFGECNGYTRSYPLGSDTSKVNDPRVPFVPMPIPDGKGVVGIYNIRSKLEDQQSLSMTPRQYMCNNLLRMFRKDSLYRLEFYLGFGEPDTTIRKSFSHFVSRSPMKISLFGLADSTLIPFTIPKNRQNAAYGCLTYLNPAWVKLGTCTLESPSGRWVKGTIEFTAPFDIQTMGIGPDCSFSDIPFIQYLKDEFSDMYYLDALQLFAASSPKPIIEISGGQLCDVPGASVTLRMKSANYYTGSQLQWFRNNVAIPETGGSVTITKAKYGEGWYQCSVKNDTVCMRSDSFQVKWDVMPGLNFGGEADTVACTGDTFCSA